MRSNENATASSTRRTSSRARNSSNDGLTTTTAKKKKLLIGGSSQELDALKPERAFAREIQNFIGSARQNAAVAAATPAIKDFGMGTQNMINQIVEDLEALYLQDECSTQYLAKLAHADGMNSSHSVNYAQASVVAAISSSQATSSTSSRGFWRSDTSRHIRAGRLTGCSFCSALATGVSESGSIVSSLMRCQCHRYSRVFNKGNSFRSIALQSTPLRPALSVSLDSSVTEGSQSQDQAMAEKMGFEAGTNSQDTNYYSEVMTQLTTQLNACVLSPCVAQRTCDPNARYGTQYEDEEMEVEILSSGPPTPPVRRSSSGRVLSVSLGYIPAAFPLQTQDFRFGR
ncbi:hypothetical protein EW145_g2654 [Phellinidium pouzarii]|uniref:Uncharacterized protein n=1 Tax=Phellinidium pouzarii TaxID=167371 RepID=A0A4S4LBI3_9AGAM|nr:hypothetical protein EW145_g2654 [Phellinidium pouzarii]